MQVSSSSLRGVSKDKIFQGIPGYLMDQQPRDENSPTGPDAAPGAEPESPGGKQHTIYKLTSDQGNILFRKVTSLDVQQEVAKTTLKTIAPSSLSSDTLKTANDV